MLVRTESYNFPWGQAAMSGLTAASGVFSFSSSSLRWSGSAIHLLTELELLTL